VKESLEYTEVNTYILTR